MGCLGNKVVEVKEENRADNCNGADNKENKNSQNINKNEEEIIVIKDNIKVKEVEKKKINVEGEKKIIEEKNKREEEEESKKLEEEERKKEKKKKKKHLKEKLR
jgi:hypothetical protein